MPNSLELRRIGGSDLRVTRLGLGTVALGFLYAPVGEEEATATAESALELGLRLFDTAPLYGDGGAETRLGSVLGSRPRKSFVVSTKTRYRRRAPSIERF